MSTKTSQFWEKTDEKIKVKHAYPPYKELYSKTTFRRRHLSNFSNQSAHSNFIIDQWHSSRQIRQGLHFQLSSFQRYNIHYSAFVAYSHFPNPHYPLLKLFSFQKAELESGKLKSTTLKRWWIYIEYKPCPVRLLERPGSIMKLRWG